MFRVACPVWRRLLGLTSLHECDAYNAMLIGKLVQFPSRSNALVLVCGGGVQDLKSHRKQCKPTLHLR